MARDVEVEEYQKTTCPACPQWAGCYGRMAVDCMVSDWMKAAERKAGEDGKDAPDN
jgi:hypothetical protein